MRQHLKTERLSLSLGHSCTKPDPHYRPSSAFEQEIPDPFFAVEVQASYHSIHIHTHHENVRVEDDPFQSPLPP